MTMTTKQPKQPRPGPGRVVHTLPPVHDDRPGKPAAAESPDAARSAPHIIRSGGPVKGDVVGRRPTDAELERPHKKPFEAHSVPDAGPRQPHFPDQKPRGGGGQPQGSETGDGRQQYVRLRIRLRGDQLSIIDSHLVDGPLGQVTGFPGTNAYEVTLDGRLLHAGALPDLGVQRSFPNPEGPEVQHGHFFTQRDVSEFVARVPAEDLSPETIKRVKVTLHRVSEEVRAPRLGPESLALQFERQIRPVAEIEGLPESVLPQAIEARGGRTPTA